MYDFFVIGDIMVDHIILVGNPDVVRSVDEASHTVSFPFPVKLQLDQPPREFIGGNAYNAAITMSKLGLNVAMYSLIGKDQSGEKILQQLKEAKINVDQVQQDPEKGTNQSVIMNIANDRLILSHHHVRNYSIDNFPDTKFVYLTSLGENDEQLLKQVVEAKKQKGFQLIFSPGTRQIEEPFADIKPVLEHTDYLILNKQEAISLSRLKTESVENLLSGLHRFGPKHVVMTRSSRGSVAFDGQQTTKVGALPTEGIDSTGAGDCYAATVSAALSLGKDLVTAMQWGAINAASELTVMGATNGSLNRSDLESAYSQKVAQLVYQEPPSQTQPQGEPQVITG